MNLNPLGINPAAIVNAIVALPKAIIEMSENVARLRESASVLPDVDEHLSRIDRDVERMKEEVAAMRAGVDSLNAEVAAELGSVGEMLNRIPFVARRGRRDAERTAAAEAEEDSPAEAAEG
jgi:hypothetical protein